MLVYLNVQSVHYRMKAVVNGTKMDNTSFTNMLFQLNHTPKCGFNFRGKTGEMFEKVQGILICERNEHCLGLRMTITLT